jgi:hypothetical protein
MPSSKPRVGTFSLRNLDWHKGVENHPPPAERLRPVIDGFAVKPTLALRALRPGDDVLYRLDRNDEGGWVAVFVRKFDPAHDPYIRTSVRAWGAGAPGTGKRR